MRGQVRCNMLRYSQWILSVQWAHIRQLARCNCRRKSECNSTVQFTVHTFVQVHIFKNSFRARIPAGLFNMGDRLSRLCTMLTTISMRRRTLMNLCAPGICHGMYFCCFSSIVIWRYAQYNYDIREQNWLG